MLTGIRNVTRGWIAGGLMTLLIFAFAIWGINDVFNSSPSDAVASGGGVHVSAKEFKMAFDNTLNQAREQNGGRAISTQEAVDNGVDVSVLQRMIAQKSLDKLANQMGIGVSDSMLAKQLRGTQAFHSQITNQFDKETYQRLLAQNGLTPASYEESLRGDARREQLANSVAGGQYAPRSFGELIFRVETETRSIALAAVPAVSAGKPPTPTEADLQAYYNQNKVRFATPEYRKLTLVLADPTAFASKVEVPEEDIRKQYEYEKPRLGAGEKRSFVQISAPTQAAANEAASRLAAGEDPKAIAAAMKLQAIPFASVDKAQVPDAALAEAVFKLNEGQTTGAIKGSLAWAAARVSKIEPGTAPSYESLREKLRGDLAKQSAATAVNDAIDKFEEERSGGKSLEDAAKATGLAALQHDKVDAQGRDAGGAPIQGLSDNPALLRAIAATSVSETTEFTPTTDGAGYVLARIDDVIPPGTRPLEEVRPSLVMAWQTQKIGEILRKTTDDFIAAVKAGASFTDAAKARRLPVGAANATVTRQTVTQSPAAVLGGQIFAAAKGDLVSAPAQQGDAILIAQVNEITRQDPSANPQMFEQARQITSEFLAKDMVLALQQKVVRESKVKMNEKLRRTTLGLTDPSQDAANQ
jgi:peptidyl-prolyl cis-trans isomerase D